MQFTGMIRSNTMLFITMSKTSSPFASTTHALEWVKRVKYKKGFICMIILSTSAIILTSSPIASSVFLRTITVVYLLFTMLKPKIWFCRFRRLWNVFAKPMVNPSTLQRLKFLKFLTAVASDMSPLKYLINPAICSKCLDTVLLFINLRFRI